MIRTPNIQSLTEFQRNTKATLDSIAKSGDPLVLTVNGRAQAVLQDAAAYQKLLDRIEHFEAIEAIRESMKEFAEGKGMPLKDAVKQVRDQIRSGRRG
jgi:prevent-host-death family protein